MVGEGFLNGKIVTRPLYILLLAIWHGMEGQDYAEIVAYANPGARSFSNSTLLAWTIHAKPGSRSGCGTTVDFP